MVGVVLRLNVRSCLGSPPSSWHFGCTCTMFGFPRGVFLLITQMERPIGSTFLAPQISGLTWDKLNKLSGDWKRGWLSSFMNYLAVCPIWHFFFFLDDSGIVLFWGRNQKGHESLSSAGSRTNTKHQQSSPQPDSTCKRGVHSYRPWSFSEHTEKHRCVWNAAHCSQSVKGYLELKY